MGATLIVPISPARAQDTVTPIAPPQPVAAVPPQAAHPAYTRPQLERMLAPIALYPDQLLGQILMASTYPLEVVEADRWVRDPAHAGLKGADLEAALAPIDWDPSVKSLVPFPQVLATMDEHLDWTQSLGEAFVAQQPNVMDTVQVLRRQAEAAGYLRSSPQMSVAATENGIVIEPANPEIVYVPIYDPTVVYGPWPYPVYPPVEIYATEYYSTPIFFGAGFVIVRSFWGWNRCDWAHHRVWIDPPRVNAINAAFIARHRDAPVERHTWQFDPHHRRGLAVPAAATAPASGSSFRSAAPRAAAPTAVSRPASPREPGRPNLERPNFERHGPDARSPASSPAPAAAAPSRNSASPPSLAAVPAAPNVRPPEHRHEAMPANVPHEPRPQFHEPQFHQRVEHAAPSAHAAPPPRVETHAAPHVSAPAAPAPQHAAPAHSAPQHNSSSERKNEHH